MVRRYLAVLVGVALALTVSGTALAKSHRYKATATGKLVATVDPASDEQCVASASTIDLAGKSGPAVQRFAEPWGCQFTVVLEKGPDGTVIARTKGTATGITKYGQRAATQGECDELAGVLDIIDGLMNDPKNSQFLTGLSMVFSGVVNVGEAMGCVFTSF